MKYSNLDIIILLKENNLEIQEKLQLIDINKIFEINFSLNKENSNGLGLYIVKNILFNYGIKYKVEKSEIGIVFLIELSGNMDK